MRDAPRQSLAERFWPKVDVRGPDECWPWIAGLHSGGYGKFGGGGSRGPTLLAHRVAYELEHGSIPAGLSVDHTCHNGDDECPGGITCLHRRCCNPAHLEAISQGENVLRGKSLPAAHARKTHCYRGHPFDDENTVWTERGRYCRRCSLDWHRARRVAAGAGIANATKTHCPHGHPYDDENTRYRASGKRDCKACDRERHRAKAEKQKSSAT